MTTKIIGHPTGSKTFDEFYDAVGGDGFFTRLAARFYQLVAEDDLLSPLFPSADWPRQARLLSEHFIRLWGDDNPTEAWRPGLHRVHSHRVITREQRLRWLGLIRQAATDSGAPAERLEEFMTFMRIGSGEMMAVSRGAAIARGESFGWDGHPVASRDQRDGG